MFMKNQRLAQPQNMMASPRDQRGPAFAKKSRYPARSRHQAIRRLHSQDSQENALQEVEAENRAEKPKTHSSSESPAGYRIGPD